MRRDPKAPKPLEHWCLENLSLLEDTAGGHETQDMWVGSTAWLVSVSCSTRHRVWSSVSGGCSRCMNAPAGQYVGWPGICLGESDWGSECTCRGHGSGFAWLWARRHLGLCGSMLEGVFVKVCLAVCDLLPALPALTPLPFLSCSPKVRIEICYFLWGLGSCH